jgi:hypothetical protein
MAVRYSLLSWWIEGCVQRIKNFKNALNVPFIRYPFTRYPSTHLPIYPSTHLPIYPYTHLPIYPYTHLPIYPFTHIPIYPSTHLPIYPSTRYPFTHPPGTHLPGTHLPGTHLSGTRLFYHASAVPPFLSHARKSKPAERRDRSQSTTQYEPLTVSHTSRNVEHKKVELSSWGFGKLVC